MTRKGARDHHHIAETDDGRYLRKSNLTKGVSERRGGGRGNWAPTKKIENQHPRGPGAKVGFVPS